MATRGNPADRQREREELRREIENTEPEDISLGMMPLGPEDLRGIFGALKVFRTKFPAQAGGLIARVGKMLKATPEEMEAGLKTRARNDWTPKSVRPHSAGGSGVHRGLNAGSLGDAAAMVDRPVDVGRALRRALPEEYVPEKGGKIGHVVPTPTQGPNTKRAADAAVKATEKIVTRVEAAIKNAPKK